MFDFFLNKGWSREETMECPIYLAYMLMGAITEDKIGLKLSEEDGAAFQAALAKKREGLCRE